MYNLKFNNLCEDIYSKEIRKVGGGGGGLITGTFFLLAGRWTYTRGVYKFTVCKLNKEEKH